MRFSTRWKHGAEQALVWSGGKKQTNSPYVSVKKKKKKSSDEQETKPGCSVAMATATRQSAFL